MSPPFAAVIFDLAGTLVVFSAREQERTLADMAAVLRLTPEDFARCYRDTYVLQEDGGFASVEAYVEEVARQLRCALEPERRAEASRLRVEFTRRFVGTPRSDAADTLMRLRATGYRIGMITNCPPEVPLVWPDTPLASLVDVPVFSCLERVRKPDARIYRLAADRLGVPVGACLYVGDGGSRELSGAAAVGMTAVLLRIADEDPSPREPLRREPWPEAATIAALGEVLAFAT